LARAISRKAQLLQIEEGCAGGHERASHRCHARSGRRPKVSRRRPFQALPTHLAALCCVTDASAIFDQTTIDISAGDYTFRATGTVQKFDGYLRVYQMPASIADRDDDEKDDEGEGRALPQVAEGQTLRLDKIRPDSTSPSRRRGSTTPR